MLRRRIGCFNVFTEADAPAEQEENCRRTESIHRFLLHHRYTLKSTGCTVRETIPKKALLTASSHHLTRDGPVLSLVPHLSEVVTIRE